MHPALPLLLVLSLAPLPWLRVRAGKGDGAEAERWRRGRWRWGIGAWLVTSLAATALVLPALLLPDGIVSPSAILQNLAPWHGAVSKTGDEADSAGVDLAQEGAARGNPNLVDVTFQVEPWLLFLRREVRAGRMPYWNPYQSAGAPYWGNGSSAPLFPLHLLFVLLPVKVGFVLLPWLRVVIGGMGAFYFARELTRGPPEDRGGPETVPAGALLAAVAYPLSGRLVAFLLYPMANAMALVPWAFLAIERMAARSWAEGDGGEPGRRRRLASRRFSPWQALALVAGLQLLAGHPETPVFTGMAGGIYLLARFPWRAFPVGASPAEALGKRLRSLVGLLGRYAGAWAVGLLLAGVAVLPLAYTLFESERWHEWDPGRPNSWGLIAALSARFLFPDAFGNTVDGDYWGPLPFTPTTVYAGALVLPLALAGLAFVRRDVRLRGIAVTAAVCFAASYHVPGVREVLLVVPVVRKGLHHYLLPAVFLGAAVLAAAGLEGWLARRRGREMRPGRSMARPIPWPIVGSMGAVVVAAGAVWAAFHEVWREQGQLAEQGGWTAWLLGAALLLAAGAWLPGHWRRRLVPLLLVLAAADLAWANGRSNPALSASALYPETGAVRFLAGRPERVAAVGLTLRPNAGMVYQLHDIRGDDSLKLRHYEALYRDAFGGGHPTFFRPIQRWDEEWLDRLGVRWVMAAPGAPPPVPATAGGGAWSAAYRGPDAVVYERPGALPLVRWEGGGAEGLRVEVREPGRWEIAWRRPAPSEGAGAEASRIVVASTWDLGWRARAGGEARRVDVVDGVLMGVDVGQGSGGRLVLTHRPAGLGWGLGASALGLVLLLAPTLLSSRLRRRGRPGGSGREVAASHAPL